MLNYAGLHRFVELTKETLKVKSLSFPDYIVSNVCSVKCLGWGSSQTKLSGLIDITLCHFFNKGQELRRSTWVEAQEMSKIKIYLVQKVKINQHYQIKLV